MSDVTQSPAPQPVPTMSPQQAISIKQAVLENYGRQYMDFVQKINQYPCHLHLRNEAFRFFDAASALMEKAIANMQLAIATPQPQAPEEPAQTEVETPASEANQPPLDAA
jgi:hypothetical protein